MVEENVAGVMGTLLDSYSTVSFPRRLAIWEHTVLQVGTSTWSRKG